MRPSSPRIRFVAIALTLIAAMASTLLATQGGAIAANTPGCATAATASPVAALPMTAGTPPAPVGTEAPAQPEQNPAGDIPDSQAFVTYTSASGGYAIAMPEGWARQEQGAGVQFSDKLHTFSVSLSCASTAPTMASATAETQPGSSLHVATPAFELVNIDLMQLPAGSAIHISYRGNSAPDDVTGKQHRVDIDRYELFHNGHLAIITLTTPAGSDNVDVARHVSESFTWQD